MRSEDLERLELQAAIAVFSQPTLISGDELRFARKPRSIATWPAPPVPILV